jgi:integrase
MASSFASVCKRAALPVCEPPKKGRKRTKRPEGAAEGKEGVATRRGEGFRLYDLRHTCATLLLLADVPAKIVFERLGHNSITGTLDTYSHVLLTMQKRAADTLGRLLGTSERLAAEGV